MTNVSIRLSWLSCLLMIGSLFMTRAALVDAKSNILVAHRLRESTDLLTRNAFAYIATGRLEAKEKYLAEIQFRGPRAVNLIKFRDVASLANAYAESAMEISDHLATIEIQAFEQFEAGDVKGAQELLFGDEYDNEKTAILEKLSELQHVVDDNVKPVIWLIVTIALCLMAFGSLSIVGQQRKELTRWILADPYLNIYEMIRRFPDGGIVLADNKGTVQNCNENFAHMIGGVGVQDIVGRSVDEFTFSDHAEQRKNFVRDLYNREVTVRRLDDTELPVLATILRLNENLFMIRIRRDEA